MTDGHRAVFVGARIVEDIRVDQWDAATSEVIEQFQNDIGSVITLESVFRQSDYTTARLGELAGNLVLGSFVVIVVIFLTMGWRRSLIVSVALPLRFL